MLCIFFLKLNFSHFAKIFIEIRKWILLNTFKVVFLLIQGHVKLMNPLKNLYLKVFKLKQIAKKESEAFTVPKYYVVCIFFLMIHVLHILHCIRRIGTSRKMNKSLKKFIILLL